MDKQNLNIGDKLLCKNDLKSLVSNNTSLLFFKKGKYYVVDEIRLINDIFVDYNEYFYYIIDDNNERYSFWMERYLYTYFYTKNEIRSMKLNEINEGS